MHYFIYLFEITFKMVHHKLINTRKSRNLSQLQMAEKVAMEQTTYSRKERGKSPITEVEWKRFAEALEVSVDDIKDELSINLKNESCTFNNDAIGIQYVNIPQNVFDIVLKYNQKLEEEINNLKNKLNRPEN